MDGKVIDETKDTITIQYDNGIMVIDKETGMMISWTGSKVM